MTKQEVINDTLVRLEQKLSKESKVYGIFTIILSILDVLLGGLCIIFTTLQVASVVVSILSGAVVCTKGVQIIRAKNILKSIRVLNGVSSAYVVCRMKKGEYMKNFKNAIKNNPLTLLFAIIGAIVMGFAGYTVAQCYFAMPIWGYVLIGVGCALLTIFVVVLLGWDKAKAAILRTAKKTLTSENYEKLVETVTELEQKQAEDAKAKADEDAYQKDLDKAKATVEAYEQAKKLLEEDAKKQANSTDTQV